MIENKQVNLWRGTKAPPTLYHIWLKDEKLLLRYDEEKRDWVVFLDSENISKIISEFMDNIEALLNTTINGHPFTDNPVLNATDLKVGIDGTYIKSTNNILQALKKFDELLTTKVYE